MSIVTTTGAFNRGAVGKLVGVDPREYLRAIMLASVRGEPATMPHDLVGP